MRQRFFDAGNRLCPICLTDFNVSMIVIRITILSVSEENGLVPTRLCVNAPSIAASARTIITFAAPAGTNPEDWRELAYNRALMRLDPA